MPEELGTGKLLYRRGSDLYGDSDSDNGRL